MTNLDILVERLGNVSHFKGLPEAALRDIVFAGQLLNFKENSIIFNEGELSSGLYVLFRGQVHLIKLGLHGQETIVARIKPVIMFNEVSTIDGGPNAVTAIAALDCTTWQISTERYQMLMERYPEMGTGLLRVLATRNRLMLNRYQDLFCLPVIARVAKVVLDLSVGGEKPISRRRYPNKKFAALAATVPEAVSRSIKSLREMGMIEFPRSSIRVLSLELLNDIVYVEPIEFV